MNSIMIKIKDMQNNWRWATVFPMVFKVYPREKRGPHAVILQVFYVIQNENLSS